MNKSILISARALRKSYRGEGEKGQSRGSTDLEVLRGLDLDIYTGDALCIMGSSGAGKSTLLHLLGALDRPTGGTVYFQNRDLFKFSDDELGQFRNKAMSFVFQF